MQGGTEQAQARSASAASVIFLEVKLKYSALILLCFFSSIMCADEIEMFSPLLLCKKAETGHRYPYEYFARFYLKNISNTNIKLVSKVEKSMYFKNQQSESELHFSTLEGGTINNIPIIPSVVDLKLVELKTGEAAYIEAKFWSERFLEKVKFIYNIGDNFDRRFNYWTGSVSLSNVKLTRPEHCKK
ncbi:Uncharacterised protein [BD1-7 clade bacterium]|uniref:Uncharacterized protein n=1 Tax=BD1-7 clade bacterium TaxID=2029982 RepID=A0A5S9NQI8_9GAMM|nr:Uncharacterised protein [BD1-7 clade bacterium]